MQSRRPTKPKRPTSKWEATSPDVKAAGIIGLAVIAFIIIGIIAKIINQHMSQSQPSQPTTAQQVSDWYRKYQPILQTVVDDYNKIVTNPTNINTDDITSFNSAVNAKCQQLLADTNAAQSLPAFPDAQTASDLSSSLSYMATGARDCIDGTANYDTSLIVKAGTELKQAAAKLNVVVIDIKALSKAQ